MTYSVSELLSYFGGFLGIIISVILLFRAKGNKSVRISLACYLIIGSVAIILGPLTYSGKIMYFPHLLRIDSPIHFLFIPIGFFFVYSVFKPGFRFRWIHILNFLPFLFDVIYFTPFYLKDAAFKTAYYYAYVEANGTINMPWHYFAKSISLLVYFALQVYVFLHYKSTEVRKPGLRDSTVIWFWIFLSGEAIMIAGIFLDQLAGIQYLNDPYRFSMGMITFFVYDISLSLLFFPAMLYGNEASAGTDHLKKKYERSKLTSVEKDIILENLNLFLKHEGKPYLNPKLSLHEVSAHLGVVSTQLSQVVNEKTGLNFNDYINIFRVEEIKGILVSPESQKLTIEAIATMAGFNSKSPFYAAFKKHTGMTPKEFISLQDSGN
jgi:AraC-like DNA-binding protein